MSNIDLSVYNFDSLQDRVKYCCELAGNPSRLANLAGVSRSQVWRVVDKGTDMTTDTAKRIAKAANVDPGWMLTGEGNPLKNRVQLEEAPIRLGEFAGDSLCPIRFEPKFFKANISNSPDRCSAYQIKGSEHPVLKKGTWCIVDESTTSGIDGEFLIEFSGTSQVRYLEFLPTEAIRVQGNLKQKEYVLNQDESHLINVIGKVIWSELRE